MKKLIKILCMLRSTHLCSLVDIHGDDAAAFAVLDLDEARLWYRNSVQYINDVLQYIYTENAR